MSGPLNCCVKLFDDYTSVLDLVLTFSHDDLAIVAVGDFKVNLNPSRAISAAGLADRLVTISDALNFPQMVSLITRCKTSDDLQGVNTGLNFF